MNNILYLMSSVFWSIMFLSSQNYVLECIYASIV